MGSTTASAATKATGSPISFGTIAELTGPEAEPSVAAGLEAYVANWNAHGGYKGHRINLIVKDDALNPSMAESEARSLVQEQGVVGMVIGGSLIDSLVNNQYYISQGIGDLGGGSPTSYDPKIDFPVQNFNSSNGLVIPMKYAVLHGAKKIALLTPPLGSALQTAVNECNAYLAGTDAKLVVPTSLPFVPTAADIDGVLAQMKAEGVDAVFGLLQGSTSELLVQEANRQSFGPKNGIKYLFGDTTYAPSFAVPLTGAYSVAQALPWSDTSNPSVKAALAVVKEERVSPIDGFVASGYDYGALLQDVLDKVHGPVTRASFIAAMEHSTSVTLPLAPIKLDLDKPSTDLEGGSAVESVHGSWVGVSPFLTSKY